MNLNQTKIVKHPSVILVTGKRRSGKSALAYHILEKFYNEYHITPYVVSLPKEKHYLLPSFITPVDTVEQLPENCIALIDEGSLSYHAYLWHQKPTIVMDRLISVSGQKKQTFIFISHTMRKFAVTLLLEIDTLLCKEPSLFHSKLERSETRKITEMVLEEFRKLPKEQVKRSTFVISEEFKGFIHNPLPSFWSQELSEAFAGIDIENIKKDKNVSKHMQDEFKEEEEPTSVIGGLKIWCKPEDKEKVLDIIGRTSGVTLSNNSMTETGGKSHIDFDLKQIYTGTKRNPIPTGRYRLTSEQFNIPESIMLMRQEGIPYAVDTETGHPILPGMSSELDTWQHINQKNIVFEEKQKKEFSPMEIKTKDDKLSDFAKKIPL